MEALGLLGSGVFNFTVVTVKPLSFVAFQEMRQRMLGRELDLKGALVKRQSA